MTISYALLWNSSRRIAPGLQRTYHIYKQICILIYLIYTYSLENLFQARQTVVRLSLPLFPSWLQCVDSSALIQSKSFLLYERYRPGLKAIVTFYIRSLTHVRKVDLLFYQQVDNFNYHGRKELKLFDVHRFLNWELPYIYFHFHGFSIYRCILPEQDLTSHHKTQKERDNLINFHSRGPRC